MTDDFDDNERGDRITKQVHQQRRKQRQSYFINNPSGNLRMDS